MIDTHSHIFDTQFDTDRGEAMRRAVDAGVEKIILPAIDSASHEKLIRTAIDYPGVCIPAMGLHPTSVNDNPAWPDELAIVEEYYREPPVRFYAVGEVGLDMHWSRDFLEQQIEAFVAQIELAVTYDLPLIIHTRDAWDEMLAVMKPYAGKVRGVFHSFSGDAGHWEAIRRMGNFMVGIGGVVTYGKSNLRETLTRIPMEYILLETDSPYLPPVPLRGKRNESSYLPIIARAVAAVKGITTAEVDRITTANAKMLFNI